MKKLSLLTMVFFMISGLAMNTHAQSLNFKIGLFQPSLQSDLWEINMENLAFEKQDLQGRYFGVEYEHFLGKNLSIALEGGYYSKEHYSLYRDFEYDDGSSIFQNMALEIFVMEVDFKFYPMGHRTRFFPYFGAGGGVYRWKYEQWGDFIDFEDNTVMEDEYLESSAYTPGFNAKAGFVLRPSRQLGISVEARYQSVKGELSSFFEGFEKLDLSGFTVTAGIHIFVR
ncbi:MAG: porin family protein [bacterium]|nr:porin family protein [bacterium]